MIKAHALAAWRVDGHAILALVSLKSHMGFPFALEITLLGGDTFGAPEKRIAAKVFVTFLNETKASLVPDKSVDHQFGERCVDVAFAFEQFIPLRRFTMFVANNANRTADPVVDPERIVAL